MYQQQLWPMIVLSATVPVLGCFGSTQTDSWAQFENGAIFDSASPSMSPDGTWIVFASPRTGHGDIYRIRLDGTDRIQLTSDPGFECNPLYCADGEQIVFARENNGLRHIWIMQADGTKERQITFEPASDTPYEVSNGEKWLIVFRSKRTGGLGNSGETVAICLDSNEKGPIRLGYDASFSPDGTHILFSPVKDEIWQLDLATLERRRIGRGNMARYFPNGERILYLSLPSDSLWKGTWRSMRPDGMDDVPVGNGTYALITSDGQDVVYMSSDHKFEILRGSVGDYQPTEVDAPAGYKTWMRRCKDGFIFTVLTDDRAGHICVLSTEQWTVNRIAPVR